MNRTDNILLKQLAQQNAMLGGIMAQIAQKNGLLSKSESKDLLRTMESGLKHTLPDNAQTADVPFNEQAFFVDCELDRQVANFTVNPLPGLFNDIPAVGTRFSNRSTAVLTGLNTTATGALPNEPCDDPEIIGDDATFCKIKFPFGCRDLRSKTLEVTELVNRACQGIYDDFRFYGQARGVPIAPDPSRITTDENYIQEGAVRKQLSYLTREHQIWGLEKFWAGDPAANTAGGGYSEPIGLLTLVNGDYPGDATLSGYLESSTGDLAACEAMNADVKDFQNQCLGNPANNPNIYRLIQELEDTIWNRAFRAGMLPGTWKFVMMSVHWTELTKTLPCQMSSDGCTNITVPSGGASGAIVNLNDGGQGFFNMEMRESMRSTRTITVNGRSYPVVLDDSIPYQFNATTNEYTAPIFLMPYNLAGMDVLFIEYLDYSALGSELAPLPGSATDMLGWTDSGRFHMAINFFNRCFSVSMKNCWRIVFKGSRFAGRIDNVVACPLQEKPLFFDPV